MQIDSLSAPAKKFDEVHFSLEKESKETWYDVCPRCKEKVNNYSITQYLGVECQTENRENPFTKSLLYLTPYPSTDCERQGTGRNSHTYFAYESSTQQSNELKPAVENGNRDHGDEVKSLKLKKTSSESQRKRIQDEIQKLQNELDKLHINKVETESELTRTQEENKHLIAYQSTSEERLRTLQKRHDELKSETKTSQQEHDQIKQTLEEKIKSLTQKKKKAQDEYMCLKAECDKQKEELRKFKQQLEELKKPQKKRVVLGLRSEKSGLGKSLVDMVTKGLTKRLQERLDMSNLNLMVSFSQNPSDVTNGFQIVICLNMSRVGTNIADSLKGMKVDRDVFVMVLHHTNKENLSALTPTSHRVTGNEVRQLGGILDMAFSSDGGLYECDLNNVAVEKIASILRKCLIF
ncbi:uncharacterized protein LOC117323584 [Pecten maximus]|uniref:uncharacterized protein LOC117323584 n=1 Tax=Pecten maximus TaxID=6579 RepID=UPI001458FA94|nr:uncharacterized protein LOC117323584 [Pecten maximus]